MGRPNDPAVPNGTGTTPPSLEANDLQVLASRSIYISGPMSGVMNRSSINSWNAIVADLSSTDPTTREEAQKRLKNIKVGHNEEAFQQIAADVNAANIPGSTCFDPSTIPYNTGVQNPTEADQWRFAMMQCIDSMVEHNIDTIIFTPPGIRYSRSSPQLAADAPSGTRPWWESTGAVVEALYLLTMEQRQTQDGAPPRQPTFIQAEVENGKMRYRTMSREEVLNGLLEEKSAFRKLLEGSGFDMGNLTCAAELDAQLLRHDRAKPIFSEINKLKQYIAAQNPNIPRTPQPQPTK